MVDTVSIIRNPIIVCILLHKCGSGSLTWCSNDFFLDLVLQLRLCPSFCHISISRPRQFFNSVTLRLAKKKQSVVYFSNFATPSANLWSWKTDKHNYKRLKFRLMFLSSFLFSSFQAQKLLSNQTVDTSQCVVRIVSFCAFHLRFLLEPEWQYICEADKDIDICE